MTTTESCAECGTRAEPGQSFCDACGAVLSWTDRAGAGRESDAQPEQGPARAEPPAAPASAGHAGGGAVYGFVDGAGAGAAMGAGSGQSAVVADGTALGGHVAPAPDGGSGGAAFADAPAADGGPAGPEPCANTSPPAAPPTSENDTAEIERVPADAPAAPAPAFGHGMDRARQLLVPVEDPGPRSAAAPSVAPVLPGRPEPQRPQAVRAVGEELGVDGGVPCPWCSTANHSGRHFCVRCAMPMTGQEQAGAHRPWWRRVLDFRTQQTPWAGDRPRLRRTFDRVLSWLGAAIVLTLVIVLAANVPTAVQAIKDHFAKRTPVAPNSVTASRSFPGHPATMAFDKWNNTWWGPGVSETGKGQWIEATFDPPTRLLDLVITSGVSIHPDQLQKEALPHLLTATVTNDKGKTFTRELTLDQASGGQPIPFRVGEVTRVRFTIDSAYFADANKQVAIAEIEFFGPSSRH